MFSSAILGLGTSDRISQGCVDPTSPNLARHRTIIAALHFCFRLRISCCIFKRGRLKVEWCWKRRQVSHFLTLPLWKLGKEWARCLYQMLKLYLRKNLRNTFDGHPLHGCWARWIDNKIRERVNCECIATRGRPRCTSPFPLTTPCHVLSRWTFPLPYYSVFAANILLHAVTLILKPRDFDLFTALQNADAV